MSNKGFVILIVLFEAFGTPTNNYRTPLVIDYWSLLLKTKRLTYCIEVG